MIMPKIEIDLSKIAHNAKMLIEIYGSKGIDIIGVTKVVCGSPAVAQILVKSGINILADSRIENIIKMHDANIDAQFLLLRTPLSQSESVVKYADISLNSELSVIKELSKSAVKQRIKHKIILMVELGDLREGIMSSDLENIVNDVIELKGIELAGIGTNLACFGGIKPNDEKMEYLSTIAKGIENKFKLKLEFVSGGNSANYDWFMSTKDIGKINNLRLGESIFLGCETLERKTINGLFTDAFTLIAEVTESKRKPSLPYGEVCQDAFGNIPKFTDLGLMKRAILGVGLQDVLVSGLTPLLDIDIIGASSDYIIIDTKELDIRVGDTVKFNLNYGALLSSMTSPYIIKTYKKNLKAKEYCELVERLDRFQKQLISTIIIKDDHSPLISLKESNFNLVFEPSFFKGYKYMVREDLFEKIGRISKILDKQNKRLIIRSVWRGFEHQKLLRDRRTKIIKEENPNKSLKEINEIVSYFIAPEAESMHATGGAVDALIYDLEKDCVMNFGNNDGLHLELNKTCYPFHPDITSQVRKNRELLINLFDKEDFVVDPKEYWHFDYGNVIWTIEKGEKYAKYGIIKK